MKNQIRVYVDLKLATGAAVRAAIETIREHSCAKIERVDPYIRGHYVFDFDDPELIKDLEWDERGYGVYEFRLEGKIYDPSLVKGIIEGEELRFELAPDADLAALIKDLEC